MLYRHYNIDELLDKQRVLIIYGPRRVGKTTLLEQFLNSTDLRYKLSTGDNLSTQMMLGSQDVKQIREFVEDYELLAIDEAQRINDIGWGLKILVDQVPDLYVITTGSSALTIAQEVGEPLTGRKRTIRLYPLSQLELRHHHNKHELKQRLEDYLVFGTYPEVLTAESRKEKKFVLNELTDSYLLKDIFQLNRLRASQQLVDLLKLLAFQVGQEVSLNELAGKVGLSVKTVGRYLDLLEKSFVIQRVGGFSRNLRKEVTKKAKYYFLDNGVRNAVISQFNRLPDRADVGALFENFIVMERFKYNALRERYADLYFWRTHQGQELDLVEDHEGQLRGMEIKWSDKKDPKPPADWKEVYEKATFEIINRANYLDFLL